VAQLDGGKDVAGIIAAACWLCNMRRHQCKSPPSRVAYRAFVQNRLAKGKWHPPSVVKLLLRTRGPQPPARWAPPRWCLAQGTAIGRERLLPTWPGSMRERLVKNPTAAWSSATPPSIGTG